MIAEDRHAFASRRDQSVDGRPLASWGYRVGGWLVDACLAPGIGFAIGTLIAAAGVADDTAESVAGVCIVAAWLLNTTVLVGITRGQSVGKLVGGMRIVHDNGRPARFGTGFVRDSVCRLMYLIPLAWLLDSLWPLSAERQTLRDKIVSTYVVQEPSYQRRASVLAVAAGVSIAALVGIVFASPSSWGSAGGRTAHRPASLEGRCLDPLRAATKTC